MSAFNAQTILLRSVLNRKYWDERCRKQWDERERAKGVRMKLSLSFFGERLVEVCVCVHFQETNKRSICSPGYKVAGGVRRTAIDCCTTEESKFNVPPNLFDIIYKMTTFIWHHDNRKVAFGSHSIFSAICSPMPLLNSDIAIPHTIENEKFSLERDFRSLFLFSCLFCATLYSYGGIGRPTPISFVNWFDHTHREKVHHFQYELYLDSAFFANGKTYHNSAACENISFFLSLVHSIQTTFWLIEKFSLYQCAIRNYNIGKYSNEFRINSLFFSLADNLQRLK